VNGCHVVEGCGPGLSAKTEGRRTLCEQRKRKTDHRKQRVSLRVTASSATAVEKEGRAGVLY